MVLSRTTYRVLAVLLPVLLLGVLEGFADSQGFDAANSSFGVVLVWLLMGILWVPADLLLWESGYVTPEMRERDQQRQFQRENRREIRREWKRLMETPVVRWPHYRYRCARCGRPNGSVVSHWCMSRRRNARHAAIEAVDEAMRREATQSETPLDVATRRYVNGEMELDEFQRELERIEA